MTINHNRFMGYTKDKDGIRRANMRAGKKRRVYSSKYALSSLVFCSKCGGMRTVLMANIEEAD